MADNNALRFSHFMKKHWEDKGHEVRYEMGASEHIAQWADLYYIEWWDRNIHHLYRWHKDNPKVHKPVYAVRAIDWEVWQGIARDEAIAKWVDHVITITPHIRQKLLDENEGFTEDKIALIRCGLNLDEFTHRPPKGGTNIVMPCNEIDWILKGGLEGMKIFAMLRKRDPRPWKLHIRGKWCQQKYIKVAFEDFMKKAGITEHVSIQVAQVPSMNEYFEDMDYCLIPSLKEAFGYTTAECVAKGIKPILHNWYGAEDTWPKEWMYLTPDEAVDKILEGYTEEDAKGYRKYVEDHYDAKRMMAEFDKLLGT